MSLSKFSEASAFASARVFDIGPHGSLLMIDAPEHTEKNSTVQPRLVFILDRSGSMREHSQRIASQCLYRSLIALGFSLETPVIVITFDSITERINTTVGGLTRINATSQGCTNMSGVIPVLSSIYDELGPNIPVILIAISDGQVGDIPQTVAAAQAASSAIGSRAASTYAFLYRLMSNTYANPDTRALTCIAGFNTSGIVPVVDIYPTYSSSNSAFATQLIADLSNMNTCGIRLQCPVPLLRRMPTDTPLAQLVIPSGQRTFILLASGIDPTYLLCGDTPLSIEATRLSSEQEISDFLKFIDSQLRVWSVMGTRQAQITQVIEWIRTIESMLSATVQQDTTVSVRIRDRVHSLIASVQKTQGTIISQILSLANQDKIGALNSAQAAAFLRGTQSVDLAKRMGKMASPTDSENVCPLAIRNLSSASASIEAIPETSNEATSFYSLSSPKEILEASIELAPTANLLTISDIFTITGGLGIAIQCAQGDLVDPWNFCVLEVYLGSYLSESDLRAAFLLSNGVPLQFPGTGRDSPINGVVPLRCINESAYDIYMTIAREIANRQASITMRGIMGCVPYDCLARDAATLLCLIKQIGHTKQLLEVEHFVLTGLLQQIGLVLSTYARTSFQSLATNLCCEDPRAWLTADCGVSGILKPVIMLLASPDCAALRANPRAIALLLRILFTRDAYYTARRVFRDGGRAEALHALLGIDLEESRRHSNVGELFAEDGAYEGDIRINFQEISARALTLAWMPSAATFAAIARFAIGIDPVLLSILEVDIEILCLGAAIQAIKCECEDDLVNKETRQAKGHMPGDADAIHANITEIVFDIYRADYAKRLAAKRTQEAAIRLSRLIQQLLKSNSVDDFIHLIQGIENRSAPGFQELVEGLLDRAQEIPVRLKKLWVILLGRHPDNEETIVWANGNVLNGNYDRFAWTFDALDSTHSLFQQLKAIKLRYGVYQYARSNENRHGHSNDHPSYWALGFQTLQEYQASVSPADYTAYAQAHSNCCGFRPARRQ